MERWNALLAWIDDRKDMVVDLMRIYLGIGLFVKGLQFISDQEFLTETLRQADAAQFKFDFVQTFIAHYVPLAHIGGGALLAAGLMTRISVLFQLPILIGAVFLVYGSEGLFAHNQLFQFVALVLFLLILILIHGAGRLSLDYHLKKR